MPISVEIVVKPVLQRALTYLALIYAVCIYARMLIGHLSIN